MKKTTKKLLTLALSTLFVGAGVGAAVTISYNNNANIVASAEDKTIVDFTNTMTANTWGSGDFAANMWHYRLNDRTPIATWTEANVSVNNAHLPASVLENVLINGKSIAQHNAEYKALIDNGTITAGNSIITWDKAQAFSHEISYDVERGEATYAPIFIKLVNHGAGLAGNTIDIYVPKSYMTPTEVKITKDFSYETDAYKFCTSNDITFKFNSLNQPDKYIGEVPTLNITKIPTEIEKIVGTNNEPSGWDSFLSFYPTANDYTDIGNTKPWGGTNAFLKSINFFDYVLIDGQPMGALWGKNNFPAERFMNVWGRYDSFSTRWPATMNNKDAAYGVQKITILKGFQLPSYSDVDGTVYETTKDATFYNVGNGVFVSEENLIFADDITVSKASTAGEQGELWAFEISYDGWNSTCDTYDYNYFGERHANIRKNILINGVSLYDINTTVDDSTYVYSSSPWTNDTNAPAPNEAYQLFQNPTLIRGEGNKFTIYIHKDYVESIGGIGNVKVTLKAGFTHTSPDTYSVYEDITKPVMWYTATVVTGNPRLPGTVTSAEYFYGDAFTVEAPTAEGKEFIGWTNASGEPVTVPETITEDIAIYANWKVNPYTLTVKQDGEADQTFTFGVEYDFANGVELTPNDLPFLLADILPVDETGEYEYSFVDVPDTFGLDNYTVTIKATKVKYWLTVVVGNPRMPGGSTRTLFAEGDTLAIETPTADGKTFLKWTDAYGEDVTIPDTMPAEDIAIYANWTVVPYTLTIVNGETTATYTFGVEYDFANGIEISVNDLAYVLADNLPVNTEDYTYAWAETVPDMFELTNYTFTVVETEVVKVPADGSTLTIEEALALDIEAAAGNKYYVEGTVVRYSDAYKGGLYIQDADGNEICIYGLQIIYPADEWSEEFTIGFIDFDYIQKPQVGATVKFYGEVGAYNNVNQFVDAEFEILAQPEVDPEAALPEDGADLTIADILDITIEKDTLRQYFVEGIVVEIANEKYGNLYIEDSNGNRLYVYGLYDYWTGARFDKMDSKPAVGDVVMVRSILSVYNNQIQLKNARLVDFGAAPIELNLNGETVIEIEAGNADEWEYDVVNAVGYVDAEEAYFLISWDASNTAFMVNSGLIENGGVVSAYDGKVELSFYADDFSAMTVTVTLTPYTPTAPVLPELVAGNNELTVEDAWLGTYVQFTATEAGTYTLKAAEGETNAWVDIAYYNFSWDMWDHRYGDIYQDVFATYTFEAEEGDVFYFYVSTWDEQPGTVNLELVVPEHVCTEFTDATCETPATCVKCGEAKDDVLADHNYVDGVCSVCGAEDPTTPEDPTTSEEPTTSEAPTTSEEPTTSETPSDSTSSSAAKAGCFGVVGGIGGVAALGLAAAVLLKKKEDNE